MKDFHQERIPGGKLSAFVAWDFVLNGELEWHFRGFSWAKHRRVVISAIS
jgi:hypothetical protein